MRTEILVDKRMKQEPEWQLTSYLPNTDSYVLMKRDLLNQYSLFPFDHRIKKPNASQQKRKVELLCHLR